MSFKDVYDTNRTDIRGSEFQVCGAVTRMPTKRVHFTFLERTVAGHSVTVEAHQ